MFCRQCGVRMVDNARFCTSCGAAATVNVNFNVVDHCHSPQPPVLAYVKRMARGGEPVSSQQFLILLRELETSSATELMPVIYFAQDQFCRWNVKWLFSPASDPDENASRESQMWRV